MRLVKKPSGSSFACATSTKFEQSSLRDSGGASDCASAARARSSGVGGESFGASIEPPPSSSRTSGAPRSKRKDSAAPGSEASLTIAFSTAGSEATLSIALSIRDGRNGTTAACWTLAEPELPKRKRAPNRHEQASLGRIRVPVSPGREAIDRAHPIIVVAVVARGVFRSRVRQMGINADENVALPFRMNTDATSWPGMTKLTALRACRDGNFAVSTHRVLQLLLGHLGAALY